MTIPTEPGMSCETPSSLPDDRGEIDRLREGLRRLKNQDYDSGYTAEMYAEAILCGAEPTGESTIDG